MVPFASSLAAWEWPPFINNEDIMAPLIVFAVFAVISIVVGIVFIAKALIRHRERMAMIERGMHPDYPPEQGEPQNESKGDE